MKYLLVLFLTGFSFGQTSEYITIMGAPETNVLYRGVENPLYVAIPGVDHKSISVSAPGVKKAEGDGNFSILPKNGNEVMVYLVYKNQDGSSVAKKRLFRIESLPSVIFTESRMNCSPEPCKFTREQLSKATITAEVPGCHHLFKPAKATRFDLKLPGEGIMVIEGSKLNERAVAKLKNVKRGELIVISNIMATIERYPVLPTQIPPTVIEIID